LHAFLSFFVYIGQIVTVLSLMTIIVGVTLALILLLIRVGVVRLITIKSKLTQERGIMSVLLTRGLASAVLATLTLQYTDSAKYAEVSDVFQQVSPLYINVTVLVTLATALIATIGIPVLRLKRKNGNANSQYTQSHAGSNEKKEGLGSAASVRCVRHVHDDGPSVIANDNLP
jgi:hypothetical protein